jgi:hypothetical protein
MGLSEMETGVYKRQFWFFELEPEYFWTILVPVEKFFVVVIPDSPPPPLQKKIIIHILWSIFLHCRSEFFWRPKGYNKSVTVTRNILNKVSFRPLESKKGGDKTKVWQ